MLPKNVWSALMLLWASRLPGCLAILAFCAPAAAQPVPVTRSTIAEQPRDAGSSPQQPAEPRAGCPRERPVFKIKATNDPNERRAQRDAIKKAVGTPGAIVRLGPDVDLDFSDLPADFFPIMFSVCVTLTSVERFDDIVPPAPDPQLRLPPGGSIEPTDPPPARTPHSLGPVLRYGKHRDGAETFFEIRCFVDAAPGGGGPVGEGDGARISGFRLIGPSYGNQDTEEVGIRVTRCIDAEIFNMEIAGWGGQAIAVNDQANEPEPSGRILNPQQVRIHDNYIHNNQHPNIHGHADGYGVESQHGAWAQVTHNVFDFNRHAIAAAHDTGGYEAEENLILKGGGYHGEWYHTYTHLVDAHGSGCWWSSDLCGDTGKQFWIKGNAFQYRKGAAIHIRGKPQLIAYIWHNVFPHGSVSDAVDLYTNENVNLQDNVADFDSFGGYGVCDFDGDGIDDLFLPTGVTWWFSSYGEFHWSFLSAKNERLEKLRFGYFDDDLRCDVLTESDGKWVFSSGGVEWWKPLGAIGAPLKDVAFGRFDPNVRDHRPGATLRTTHAFRRGADGQWFVTPLSAPNWQPVQSSSLPMSKLRFGDFTGDGVTDVLAVVGGHWAISESARGSWRQLNPTLGDPVEGLFIANMDPDDNTDDILRLDRNITFGGQTGHAKLTWWRSKNGVEPWREWKRYEFDFPLIPPVFGGAGTPHPEVVVPPGGFAGRFGAAPGGGTLVIDPQRRGHFFSEAESRVGASPDWQSLFPY
jgi:hypothetical protein